MSYAIIIARTKKRLRHEQFTEETGNHGENKVTYSKGDRFLTCIGPINLIYFL